MKLNNYKVLTLPFGMILVVFSQVVYPNVIFMRQWDSTIFMPYMMVMGLLIPCILLAVGKIRNKGQSSY